ncbi:HNH endonuclease [Cellulomonas endophytica]|uniref:HNH endonuclease n=1 Tax=Cellulomonas endophytica TaxID=2494735 RepID=UPI003B845219
MQADLAVALEAEERRRQAELGVPAARRGQGVAAQLGIARRVSPHRGQVLLGTAKALTEMPCTAAALRAGALDEWRTTLLVRETACLEREDRARVDAELCADLDRLDGLGTRRLVAAARRRAAELDPAALVRRRARATADRSVSLRPAPDAMTYLTALLPVAQGVGVLASLQRAADTARATGDPRPRGQLMADLLVERTTGQASAQAVPVRVDVVLPATTLLHDGDEPALLLETGDVLPAATARDLITTAATATTGQAGAHHAVGDSGDTEAHRRSGTTRAHGNTGVPATTAGSRDAAPDGPGSPIAAWVRRLYADPGGHLIATTSRARLRPDGLAALIRARDGGICRTPWCDAPIRHTDHITPAADGGPTSLTNGQGLCQTSNHTKQAPGWHQHVDTATTAHRVTTTTPGGLTATSTPQPALAPTPPGTPPRAAMAPPDLRPPRPARRARRRPRTRVRTVFVHVAGPTACELALVSAVDTPPGG